jgi:DNA-binding MarR family transcriptional regulator
MESISSGDRRRRRRLAATIKDSLRDLTVQLSLLNHHVGGHVDLRDVDVDCLALIGSYGPISPTALARRAGLHPATMTGVLDRLQRGGWIARDRDPDGTDRRAVTVRSLPDRTPEMYRLYAGMSSAMDDILGGYSDAELAVIADFVRKTTAAGEVATTELAQQ